MAAKPNWTSTKARLTAFDRKQLLELIHDLYRASRDNQNFLHTRLGVGANLLAPYRAAIERWMWPDVFRRQQPSVAKAKQAITDYGLAIGQPAGLAELMVVFCEQGVGFSADVGYDDEAYLAALCRMFERAIALVVTLPPPERDTLYARLSKTRDLGQSLGYGVSDWMDDLLLAHGI